MIKIRICWLKSLSSLEDSAIMLLDLTQVVGLASLLILTEFTQERMSLDKMNKHVVDDQLYVLL